MGQRLGHFGSVVDIARWWTSATKEARFALLKRCIDERSPSKGNPSLAEVRLAIILAETEAGEVSAG